MMMTRFLFSERLIRRPQQVLPRVNAFRDVAVHFEGDAAEALPLLRRLIDLHLSGSLLVAQSYNKPALQSYSLLVISLLLPTETGLVVMSASQHRRLLDYLNRQRYELIRDKESPFFDVAAQPVFDALMAVIDAVENYTSVKPFWSCQP